MNFDTNWEDIKNKVESKVGSKSSKSYVDERFWKLSRNENDQGAARIRLMLDPEGTPFIEVMHHNIFTFDKMAGKKRGYQKDSPATIGEKCPAQDFWQEIWNIGTEEAKKEARNFSRKFKYITNIKVIKDPLNPENDGKIFLYTFGSKLKDKFMAWLQPTEEEIAMGEKSKELYNPLKGCDITLKIKKSAGFFNYDDTIVNEPSSIYADGEEAKNDIISNAYKLSEFKSPEHYDSYEDSASLLYYVLSVYEPQHIDKEVFKNIVEKVLGAYKKDSDKSQSTQSTQEDKVETTTEPTPTVETTSETPEVKEDDDMNFLNDL